MMEPWQKCLLGDVITLKRGYDLPSRERQNGDVPVVSSSGITGFHDEIKAKAPGVVTGRYGTLGEVFYLESDFFPLNTTLYVCDFKGNNARFISYLLKTLNLGHKNVAAAVPGLNRNDLHLLPVCKPDLKTQKQIADILSTYDRLIENNTRRIKILEEMAQLLYREWFVNFRFPGHEDVKLVESAIGLIPEGWEVKTIGCSLSHYIGGGWGQEKADEKHTVPAYVIRGTDIPSARHVSLGNCPLRFHTSSNFKSRKIKAGDIIFEVSGGSKGQLVGRSLLISSQMISSFSEDVICASFCKLMRVSLDVITPEILYLLLGEMYGDGRIEKHQVQSTGITNFKFTQFLDGELIVIPPKELQNKFSQTMNPMFDLIQNLGSKNSNLRQTRDLLLPKLISGEIDVEALDFGRLEMGETIAA